MHMCCANCALYPVKSLCQKVEPAISAIPALPAVSAIELTGYWFNPNIEPLEEYNRRLEAMTELESLWGLNIIYNDAHDNALYKEAVAANDGVRCEACYSVRLERTAQVAKKMGMDAFTTSLLVSPYQLHDLIIEAGRKAESLHDISFFYKDFRPGWKEGSAMSRELGFYRQNYCGCLESKGEQEAERRKRREARLAKDMMAKSSMAEASK